MMYTPFDPNAINYDSYFYLSAKQSGHGLSTFEGTFYQRPGQTGQGFGNIFKSLFHILLPLVKSAGRSIGKEALVAGTQIAQDVLKGDQPVESVKKRGKAAAERLLNKAQTNLEQTGMGKRKQAKKSKPKKPIKRKTVSKAKKLPKKRRLQVDALGLLRK